MNVYGVGGAAQGLALPQQESPRRVGTERAPAAAPRRPAAPAAPSAGSRMLAPTAPALQSEAPVGTDPDLWSVLDAEERSFFARTAGIGPLTYSHMIHSGAPATAVVRGGRIDVRA
jgi:hypothetical protein